MEAILVKLYIKTHNNTGLKYFGRTIKEDIHKYKGSGKHWKNHIKKHGYNVKTELYGEFYEDDPLLKEVALDFSNRNDIVKSKEWTNLMLEDGLRGGNSRTGMTIEKIKAYNTKISISNKGKHSMLHSEETKDKISKYRIGKKHKNNTKTKISNSLKNLVSCIDIRNNTKVQVSKEEFKENNFYIHSTEGNVVCRDLRTGKKLRIDKNIFRAYDYYVGITSKKENYKLDAL